MSELHHLPAIEFKNKYGLTALVETGTGAGGNAIHAGLEWGFEKIASCEVNYEWAHQAYLKYANEPNVFIIAKSSDEALPIMIKFAGNRRRLFWLDAHFPPGPLPETPDEMIPLKKELEYLKTLPGIEKDVILIDDARLFDLNTRPSAWKFPIVITTDEIQKMFPRHLLSIDRTEDHVIFLLPKDES